MDIFFNRFVGFANTYDEGRPQLPSQVFDLLHIYKKDIDTVVDIGCGTGLSTEVCTQFAKNVVGIEPSEDMFKVAKTKEKSGLVFKQGLGEATGLEDMFADVVICSQAFHWMDVEKTFKEVYRILKDGGIFAIIDANYPPVIGTRLEKLNDEMIEKAKSFENSTVVGRLANKTEYLKQIKQSNLFRFAREISFSKVEIYDKERFKKYILSQSVIQQAIRNHYDLFEKELVELDNKLDDIFKGKELNAVYSYNMRIGIK